MRPSSTGSRRFGRTVFEDFANDLRASTFAGSPWPQLAARATPTQIPAGSWLFRRDDPGDAMYVVLSGRLEVVAEEPEPAVIRVLGRGDAVGELALLTGSPRSASVRARRDTYLLQVTREAFDELLVEQPDFAVALTRILGGQLQESRGLSIAPHPLPATVSLIPLAGGLDAEGFGGQLAQALRRVASVDELKEAAAETAGSEAAFGRLLDASERNHDQVLIVAGPPDDGRAWTRFALRTGDRLLALTDGRGQPPSTALHPRLLGCDLVLLVDGSPTAAGAQWIEALDPRAVHIVGTGAGSAAAVDRLARSLTGRSVGVVLSGGGARGLAHIGVLEELQQAGVVIDRVAGCSMGSYIAANMAIGLSSAELLARCHEEFVNRNPMNDYTVPVAAILRSKKARAMLQRSFGSARIEQLPLEFFCVSCDLTTSELVVHRRGTVWESVGASMCLPAIFPPAAVDGRLLVDGGVLNNLPVEEMAARGDGPVIAVDVTARFEPPRLHGLQARRSIARARELVTGLDTPVPGLKETLIRCMVLGSIDTAAAARRHADLVITPETGGIPLTAWKQLEQLRAAGREAARTALAAAPASLFP